MDTWILRMVRARCVRQIVAWALAIGCVVLLAIGEHRYIANFIQGPFIFGPSELDSILDVSDTPHYFVRITGSKAIDTGIQHVTIRRQGGVETGRSVSGVYYALLVGEKFLIVKSEAETPTTVEGELTAMPPDLDRELFNTPEMQAHRDRFYPFYVKTDYLKIESDYKVTSTYFRLPGYFAIAGVLVFAFFFVKFGVPAWKNLQDPSSHPVVKRVASWGDPIHLALEVEREARSQHYKGGGWQVTDKYFIKSAFFTFNLLRISDLLWAYKKVTRNYYNFIPAGKDFTAVLRCYGGSAEVNGPENTIDEILAFTAERAPWAVFGFSPELQYLFNKSTQDFCADVEQRRLDWVQRARTQTEA